MSSTVNQPPHYNWHPLGFPAVNFSEEMPDSSIAAAFEYVWRCKHKGNEREDLEKARWRIEREITRQKNKIAHTGTGVFRPDVTREQVSEPFGNLANVVFYLLTSQFVCTSQDGKIHCLQTALAELNRYLEAMK